ncbi:uncharacterized protein LOC117569383 [Drosophila albomicans]|uniref:Uncharacterized protein LOC117569383 n=1 Tax=Drosophila albomicans TaxID=7291 RepID=A0A6P8WXH4_DROAB|nr:uncharacterized protein LOC117569383 [Drosophila albomicans]
MFFSSAIIFRFKIVTLCALSVGLALTLTQSASAAIAVSVTPTTSQEQQLPQRIYGLLDKLFTGRKLNASAKFALLLAEFLIKQKMRYVAPTRYDRQLYYHLLHRMDRLMRNSNQNMNQLEKQILDNAFQRNVLLLPPSLKYGELNANAEYEQLAINYDNLVNRGQPNSTQSDRCMRDIVNLNPIKCKLSLDCLQVLTSEASAYGYQRTHQVLLLFMLSHHACAPILSPPQLYEELAKGHCNEILSEQNAIRSLALGMGKYKDLYLEQATICGLYGYNEFLNWRNVMEIDSWFPDDDLNNEHINDLALVFYINALLLLH